MYLEQLIITSDSGIIRDIKFKSGLNLIVDETTSASQDSGNNVGKTTLLRVIDYCLGGKEDGIYREREFNRRDEKIYNFLHDNHVVFTLKIKTRTGTSHTIVRPIGGKSSIDDQEMLSDKKFNEELGKLIFKLNGSRPTFRQLMNKFVRVESYQLNNSLRFLHSATKNTDYEALFLFLFGFRDTSVLSEKKQIVDNIDRLNRQHSKEHNIEQLVQQLHLIEKEINDLEKLKKDFDFGKNVENDLNYLKSLQTSIIYLRHEIPKLSIRLDENSKTVEQLKKLKSDVNTESIKVLYESAELELGKLDHKFKDVLNFHNKMIDNKITYIEKTIKDLPSTINKYKSELHEKCEQEAAILKDMSDQAKLGEYDNLNVKLQNKNRDRGQREEQIRSIRETDSKLASNRERLSDVDKKIKGFLESYRERLKEFNLHFSSLSEKLYNDKYCLSTKDVDNKATGTKTYQLEIDSLNDNAGTGKKRAQISAFDIAYLKYAEEKKWSVPYFVLHDQLETVFENQINTLFGMANHINGQFVVSVLSDKLHKVNKQEVEKSTIIRLSQSSKLLKIP